MRTTDRSWNRAGIVLVDLKIGRARWIGWVEIEDIIRDRVMGQVGRRVRSQCDEDCENK
jgi:hypothetical protein